MEKPVAVLTSDVHFSVMTLDLVSAALRQARDKAFDLGVPLVVAGDLVNDKAIIRGEVANRLIEILTESPCPARTIILVGNHCLLNEKGKDHALNFLKPYCEVVDTPVFDKKLNSWLLPYFSDSEALLKVLSGIPKSSRIICHQGVQTAYMGHYVLDKTSLPKEAFKDFRVVSGHYHRAQDIQCGPPKANEVGTFSYIGNPYTLSFGEANDGEKGFQVLLSDGTLHFVPTNLRKHITVTINVNDIKDCTVLRGINDIIWLKMTGSYEELEKLKKHEVGEQLFGHANFKFDKIYTDAPVLSKTEKMTEDQILDSLIDLTDESPAQKKFLKDLWRGILECA